MDDRVERKLREVGIPTTRLKLGENQILCPKCSHLRKKKTVKCLSVLVEHDGFGSNSFTSAKTPWRDLDIPPFLDRWEKAPPDVSKLSMEAPHLKRERARSFPRSSPLVGRWSGRSYGTPRPEPAHDLRGVTPRGT
jgi:hypothetical protein